MLAPSEIPRGCTHVLVRGGSFDPPTRVHIEVALEARTSWSPEAFVLFVPAARSPLKDASPRASDDDRLAMLRLALQGVPGCGLSRIELDRPPPSYTVDTLRLLRARAPWVRQWRLLIGSDQAAQFHRWRESREVIALAPPLVVVRPPHRCADDVIADLASSGAWSPAERDAWASRIAPMLPRAGSATGVRAALARGERPERDLARAVLDYIVSRGLYGCGAGASPGPAGA